MRLGRKLLDVAAAAAFLCSLVICKGEEPKAYSLAPGSFAKARARLANDDKSAKAALEKLLSEAETALKQKPLSVMDKPMAPGTQDKHDYFSIAPYYWPDPSKPTGFPYIRKDGERNPDSRGSASDAPRMGRMANAAGTLALAYYFSTNEAYAAHAARLLRVWFLAPETRMNPNFNFAQTIPGEKTGRGRGMIESRSLINVMDAASLLKTSTHWTKTDQEGLQKWISQFLDWARTSKNGKEEAAAKNNHGTYYDVQITHMALFLGKTDVVKQVLESAKTNRIATQIKADGSQPLELARADSFGYSVFNVQALFQLATLGEHAGVDLWHYQTHEGAGIRKALDFLLPYVEDQQKPWPFDHGKTPERRNIASLLRRAYSAYHDPRYVKALSPESSSQLDALFYAVE